jgi:hypothetical protein
VDDQGEAIGEDARMVIENVVVEWLFMMAGRRDHVYLKVAA